MKELVGRTHMMLINLCMFEKIKGTIAATHEQK